ncbi:hypothetical protein PanWU01x14_130450, partial [Parasponia andersonii]
IIFSIILFLLSREACLSSEDSLLLLHYHSLKKTPVLRVEFQVLKDSQFSVTENGLVLFFEIMLNPESAKKIWKFRPRIK